MIGYEKEFESIKVKHKPSGEIYEALLLLKRWDGSCIFQVTGERARFARVYIDCDNLEVDTLFSTSWAVITK